MIDLEELERLALRATPGPWHSPGLGEVHDDPNNRVILDVCWPEEGVDISESFSGGKQEDADFVACANPAAILALTAEVRRLRAQQYELMGVVADVEVGRGFDNICLKTIKRVIGVLGGVA